MAFRDFKRQCKEAEAKRQAQRELEQREKHHSFRRPSPPPVSEDSPESQSYAEKTAADYLYQRAVNDFEESVKDFNASKRTDYDDFEMANALWDFHCTLARAGAKYCRNQGLLRIDTDSNIRFRELYKPDGTMKERRKAIQQVCKEMQAKMPAWMQQLIPPNVHTFINFW